jgi:hypothetical protein
LTRRISGAKFDRAVEKLARQIAGETGSKIVHELARSAAEAELEIARVRDVRVAF